MGVNLKVSKTQGKEEGDAMKKTYISIGEGVVDPKRHADICLQLRWTENELERVEKDRDEWMKIAYDLYAYYYLGDGTSKSVREFERKYNNE